MAESPTLEQVFEAQDKAAELQKMSRNIARDAVQAQREATRLLMEFCAASGIKVTRVPRRG